MHGYDESGEGEDGRRIWISVDIVAEIEGFLIGDDAWMDCVRGWQE